MSPILAVLNEMRPRPLAIFVGEKSLTKLAMFLYGYEQAVENLTGVHDRILVDFREWLEVRLQDRVHGLENSILLKSKDEADAVDRFWNLLDEFLATHREYAAESSGLASTLAAPNSIAQVSANVGHTK